MRRCAAILVAAVAVTAPAASVAPASGPTNDGARADLRFLVEQMEQTHPNLFHGMTREEWRDAVASLDARLDMLSRDQILVEFTRLVAKVSRRGRDGHMHALPTNASHPGLLPLRVYFFTDGLHVTAALPPYGELVGGRIVAIGGRPVDEVVRAVEPLVARDNDASVPLFMPLYLLMPNVLSGLGLAPTDQPVPITVVGRDGRERTVAVAKVSHARYVAWTTPYGMLKLPAGRTVWLSHPDKAFWSKYLPSSRTLFVQYNSVQRLPWTPLLAALRRRAARADVERVVLDLRHNGGGNNTTYGALLQALRRQPFNRARRLYVLLGRMTFSAAANFATDVDRQTNAIFVGEPMGGGLNFYSPEGRFVTLSRLPIAMAVPISITYWELAPGDPRLTIRPEISAPLSSSDYFSGRDPALRAAVAHSRGR